MIKKYFFCLMAIATFASISLAIQTEEEEDVVQLPPKERIRQCLCDRHFHHFLEKTQIDEKMGDKKLHLLGVNLGLELSLYDYAEYVKNPGIEIVTRMRKEDIVECLLQNDEAFKRFKELGLLKD